LQHILRAESGGQQSSWFNKVPEQQLRLVFQHSNSLGLEAQVQLLYIENGNNYYASVAPLEHAATGSELLPTNLHTDHLLEYTDESFLIVNRELNIVACNGKFRRVYKQLFGKDVIVGSSILNYAYDNIENVKSTYQQVLRGEQVTKELVVPSGKNDSSYFALRYKPMRLADGTVEGVFVTILDITLQKKSDKLLSISEQRFQALVEHGMDVLVILTEQGQPIYASPAIEKVLGYTPEECRQLDLLTLTHPEDRDRVAAVWRQCLEHPGVAMEGATSRILHKNGSWRWLAATVTNMLDNPLVNGVVDNFRDVTDKIVSDQMLQQKQLLLEQAEANYREIFEKANDGILIFDIETGFLTEVNQKACELLGCTQLQLMSASRKQYESDVPGYGVGAAMQKFKEAVEGTPQFFEWPVKRSDGVTTWLELSLTRANIAGTDRILSFFRVIDTRKKVEAEKDAERKEKEALINSTGEIIWSVDENLKLVAANEPFLESVRSVIGYNLKTGDDVLVTVAYTEGYLKLWNRLYKKAFEGNRYTEEVYIPAMKGNPENWVEIGFNPVYTGDKVQYVTCFGRNITENKLYKQQLQFTSDKLNIAQQIAKLGVWELDLKTREFTCSKETYVIFGVEGEDFSDNLDGFLDMIHPDDRVMFDTEFQYALEGEKLLNIEYRIITPTGLVKTLVLRGSLFYDAAHQPERLNGTVQDMTERKYLQEQLIASQRQLDLIYNSVNDIIFLITVEPDEHFRFESVNQAFLNALGTNRETVINKYLHEVVPPRHMQTVLKYYRKALETGKPQAWESATPGNDRFGIITITPVANAEGKTTQIIGSVHDITAIKKAGEKLLQLNDKLKLQAKAMAASNLELERFAYVASHDLQEPLRMISSFLQLLAKKYNDQLDETGKKYIHYAVDGAERMKKLIMDLLAYSKVSTNDDELTDTDMNVLVAEVVHVLQNKIEELGAQVSVGPLPVLPHTRRTQMFQLMQNLLGNALKYHGKATPVISVTAKELEDKWEFAVKDNGVGFEQKFAETVFIMFQRLHHRSDFSGTGIGLSICKKIVEMYHGQIWVESAINEGSTFYFTIGK
ncbi:MAG: PAS domain S-box protein, partial [Chitinophagaceae bacterium]